MSLFLALGQHGYDGGIDLISKASGRALTRFYLITSHHYPQQLTYNRGPGHIRVLNVYDAQNPPCRQDRNGRQRDLRVRLLISTMRAVRRDFAILCMRTWESGAARD